MTTSSGSRPVRVALYARVSTDDQKTDLQLFALRSLAQQRGWEVIGEFVDVGWSGAKTTRPQLTAMLKAVSHGKVDVVAVWKLDRLGRSTRDLLNLVEELRVRNVQVVSAQESLDTQTAAGRAFLTMVAMMAELEREWLRERVTHGIQAAKRRGVRVGRKPVKVDVDRAVALRASGLSIRDAAKEMGVPRSVLHRALLEAVPAVPQTR